MLGPYQPEIWYNLYIMLGTAASALVGLLFVVMTLHLGPMQADPSQTMQATLHGARNNTYHLVTLMIVSALVLVPLATALLVMILPSRGEDTPRQVALMGAMVTAALAVERLRTPEAPAPEAVDRLIACARDLGEAGHDEVVRHHKQKRRPKAPL